jgi:hypothetical protein
MFDTTFFNNINYLLIIHLNIQKFLRIDLPTVFRIIDGQGHSVHYGGHPYCVSPRKELPGGVKIVGPIDTRYRANWEMAAAKRGLLCFLMI